MRLRSASVAERAGIYAVAGFFFLIMIIATLMIRENYNSKIKEFKEAKGQVTSEIQSLNNQKVAKESEKQSYEDQFKIKQSSLEGEENEYNDHKSTLSEHLAMLPPLYMKANILEVLTLKAMELNIQINSSREIPVQSFDYSGVMFVPVLFGFDIEGEYENVKRYLWLLDHVIQMADSKQSNRIWNVIVNVSSSPGEFTVVKYDESGNAIEDLYYSDPYGHGATASATGADGGYAPPSVRDARILSPLDHMRLKVQIQTYFRPDYL